MPLVALVNQLHAGSFHKQTGRAQQDWGESSLAPAWRSIHSLLLAEASRFVKARRDPGPTGVQAMAKMLKLSSEEAYGRAERGGVAQTPLLAHALDEPLDDHVVDMLEALPPSERAYYSEEDRVVCWDAASSQLFKEVEAHYAFVGGERAQYLAYFHRELPQGMWHWDLATAVKAYAGMSAVEKKDPSKQRKLLMQCAANFAWADVRARSRLGLHGGAALSRLHAPGDRWCVAAFGENNAFTRVRTPRWMWAWAAAPPVLAAEVWDVLPSSLRERCTPGT